MLLSMFFVFFPAIVWNEVTAQVWQSRSMLTERQMRTVLLTIISVVQVTLVIKCVASVWTECFILSLQQYSFLIQHLLENMSQKSDSLLFLSIVSFHFISSGLSLN